MVMEDSASSSYSRFVAFSEDTFSAMVLLGLHPIEIKLHKGDCNFL